MFTNYTESGAPLLGSQTDQRIRGSFTLTGSQTVIANTLRRIILTSTRSVGFTKDTIIRKNTSIIPNEMLVDRISMIPLAVRHLDTFDPTQWQFVLTVKNNTHDSGLMHVKASDFHVMQRQPSGEFQDAGPQATAAIFPPDPITNDTCLIASLKSQNKTESSEQEIDLTAFVAVGSAKSQGNVAFSPVSQCTFSNTLDTDPVRREKFFNDWIAVAKKIEDPSKMDSPMRESLQREWSTLDIQRCFLVNEKGEANSFDFTIESIGVRSVPEIVAEGLQATIELLKPYSDKSKSFEEMGISVLPPLNRMENGLDLIFNGQEHTLGALLQFIMSEYFMDSSLSYVGYKVPHPLEAKMTLRLGFSSVGSDAGADTEIARTLVVRAVEQAISIFTELAKSWGLNVSGTERT